MTTYYKIKKTGDYIIANSLDVNSKEWSFGNYYSNTSKDLALASFDFAKKTDETVVNALLEKISHKELFFGVVNIENDRWCELTEEQKEAVYERYMNSDKYTSILDQYLLEQLDEYIEDALDSVNATSDEKLNRLNPIEKAMEIARDKTAPKEIDNEDFDFEL